jgi:hypothetical protein
MAYDPVSNPIVAYVQPKSSSRLKQWIYYATDPVASLATDGYFTDGYARGMRKSDIVWHFDSGESTVTILRTIRATATGGVTLGEVTSAASGTARNHTKVTAAGTYTVDADDDDIIEINKTVGQATTVQLPLAALRTPGRALTIVDGKLDANTNNITVSPAGSETIVGLANWVINFNGGAVSLLPRFDEDGWLIT